MDAHDCKDFFAREWLVRGDPECIHYWAGTGERAGGRERFECRRCGAQMSEPLTLEPAVPAQSAPPRRGFAACALCGAHVHWSRTARLESARGERVCIKCIEKMI